MLKRLSTYLQGQGDGLTSRELALVLHMSPTAENQAMIELVCRLAPGLRSDGGRWKSGASGTTAGVISALETYAKSGERKVFRAEAAFRDLPPDQHPTIEELQQAVDASNGRFSLLPNQFVKFNG